MPDANAAELERVLEAWAEAKALGEEPAIETLCAGDAELAAAARTRIARLCAIDDALGLTDDHAHERPFGLGSRLGGYELTRYVGEGGFGVVFEAKRTDGLLGRFAVKVLSRSMYAPDARARFTNEGRALSIAKHEHIAAVIDAGVSDQGVPYLVMDFIEGLPLTDHCERLSLGVRDRLALFLQACAAVEHAHAKGVIHRDLKPGNMLVQIEDETPSLKVIDFGVARVSGENEQSRKRFTQEGELIGTAAYMSPEQLGIGEAEPDTRSDIYSLGVVLYELVSGWLPYQRTPTEELTVYELQRRLRESSPTSVIARRKRTKQSEQPVQTDEALPVPSLIGIGPNELNWIVMKCITLEPERRYATCRELADDIRRLLEGRPVLAGPQSRVYVTRKFIERHQAGVLASAAVILVTLGAAGLASYGLISAAREGKRAIEAEEDTRLVADFQARQLASIDAATMGDSIKGNILSSLRQACSAAGMSDAEIEAALARAEQSLAGIEFADVSTHVLQENVFAPAIEAAKAQFENQPQILGRLLRSIGTAQTLIGLLSEGLETHLYTHDMLEQSLGAENQQTLLSLSEYANTLRALGRSEEAEPILREAIEIQTRSFGPTAIPSLTMRNDYAMILFGLGRIEEAIERLQVVADDSINTLGESHNLTATIRGNLGDLLDHVGRSDEAETHHRASLDAIQAEFGPRHQATIIAKNNLAKSMVIQEKYKEALPLLEEAVALAREELGSQHPTTLLAMSNLALTLNRTGDYARALEVNQELLDTRRAVLGPEHPFTLISMNAQAKILHKLGRAEEALALAEETVALAAELLGPDRYETAIFRSSLARALGSMGQHERAEQIFERVHSTLAETIGTDNIYVRENAEEAAAMFRALDREHPGEGFGESAKLWESRERPGD